MVMNYQKSGDLELPFFHGFFKGCAQGTSIAHAQHSFEDIFIGPVESSLDVAESL